MSINISNILQKIQAWFLIKTRIEEISSNPPTTKEGQIWWCNLGQNIGSEIYGKGDTFTRPVIIYKKLSRYTFLVIPCSTKIKVGSWFVHFVFNQKEMIVALNQIRVVDYRRLEEQMGEIDQNDFAKIKQGFLDLYK